MLNFPEPPKGYSSVYLAETDKSLPQKIDPRTRYAFFSDIAKGGKSVIKSCKDLHLSRYVCYKTLKPEFINDEVEQKRLIREARVSAMLQHPNTVPTYELGRDARGAVYFTMKLVHGYTLREVLDDRESYDLVQLMDVMLQIANVLDYSHKHGVAHRDIKPENILVGPFGEVVLLDWGLAKVWNQDGSAVPDLDADIEIEGDISMTGIGKAQGTAHYMSPEQIERNPDIDYRTDIFSFGAVLYEVLCGHTPTSGEKLHEVVESVKNKVPVLPSQYAQQDTQQYTEQRIPALLEEIAMTCLQKKPDDRYAAIEEVVKLLQQDWREDLRAR
ncbi:MAG: serine/threonine protein kinase [Pseudohongiellaceae bacterium]